ncbi:MAG: Gfo/Idh/MocA family oxidoreductase [Kiritimatiellae bacterium]|nr:Gfo/Idh/MocA family oxidoreductase [Kiritimatiellia bacterium]
MTETDCQRPPLRVALMGLGRSMFSDHYPVFRRHPALFQVVAACDLMKERRDIVARDYPDCRMFRQFADMLDEPGIDLVDIATCTVDHVRHGLMSLKKGLWTLLETPMAVTPDEAQLLRGQAQKSRNRLIVFQRGMFAPDFLLAKEMMNDPRLGMVHQIRVRREDFVRRDDWQCVKRLGGGAAYYAMTDLVIQTLKLLPVPPVQMWSELKRLASLGDAEDYAHLILKTRDQLSADIEFNGGCLPGLRAPSFELRGERGVFRVEPGATEGELVAIDPSFSFPRRRSSVRTPPMEDLHEQFPVVTEKVSLPKGAAYGPSAFWRHVYDTVRTAAPFPLQIEDSIEAVKFAHLMKKTSPFGK